jgi:hypothetical protein
LSSRGSTQGSTVLSDEGWGLREWRVVGFTSFPRHVAMHPVAIAQRVLCRFALAACSTDCTTGMVTPTPARVARRAVLAAANAHGRFAGHIRVRQVTYAFSMRTTHLFNRLKSSVVERRRACLSGHSLKIPYYMEGNPDNDPCRDDGGAWGSIFTDGAEKGEETWAQP